MSTSMMNREQKTLQNAAVFRKKFHTLARAAVSVILCRTREPYRAIEQLNFYAQTERRRFKVWSVIRGWDTYNHARPGETTSDNMREPNQALASLKEESEAAGGVYVMLYPHVTIKTNLGFVVQLKEYAHQFPNIPPEAAKRLVLLVPPGFTLPPEIEEDIAILDFDPPSYAELHETFTEFLGGIAANKRPTINADGLDRLIAAASGLTAHEASTALSRSVVENAEHLREATPEQLRSVIMSVKVEAVRKTDILEVMETESIEQVGGLDNLKEWLSERRNCFSDEARAYGIEPPKGMLLVGPPGTGKSLAAKATGAVMGLPLIKFDVSRVFAGVVGESEQRVRAALKMIESMAPCVVLIDEVDKALGGAHSGGGDSGVSKRVLGALLTWMQETKAPVFNVLSANRVDTLPSELLRKGRVDEVWSVSAPNEQERLAILRIHLLRRGKNPDHIANLEAAVARSEGYVAAEIEAAVKDSLVRAFNANLTLDGNLIAQQFENTVPLSQAFADDFAAMRQWAEHNARPANRDYSLPASEQRPNARARQRPAPALIGGRRQLDGLEGN